MSSFQKHRTLCHDGGDRHGKLLFPVSCFAIFANISRNEINDKEYSDFFPATKVWTSDFLKGKDILEDEFEKALLAVRDPKFLCALDSHQIIAMKRSIGVATVMPIAPPAQGAALPDAEDDDIGTLDADQNKLVRHKVQSQLLVEGPAGSGKSVVLLNRALFIQKQHSDWRIGIICFNALMANYLRAMLSAKFRPDAPPDTIDIYDVYEWVKAVGLKSRGVSGLANDALLRMALEDASWELDVQYDAILVDEGQDATDTQVHLYKAMLSRPDGSFTFFYDKRQRLYALSVVDELREYGFDVEEKQLVRQQRSALVILAIAFYRRLNDKDEVTAAVESAIDIAKRWFIGFFRWASAPIAWITSVVAKSIGHSRELDLAKELGAAFEFTQVADATELVGAILDRIQLVVATGDFTYGEACILLPDHYYCPGFSAKDKDQLRQLFGQECVKRDVKYTYVDYANGHTFEGQWPPKFGDNRRTADLALNTVKVMTIHTSKGYDSKLVFVAGFDGIDTSKVAAQLGYVALTRAKRLCCAYFVSENNSVIALRDVLMGLKERKIELSR